jgi:hypothetical protein
VGSLEMAEPLFEQGSARVCLHQSHVTTGYGLFPRTTEPDPRDVESASPTRRLENAAQPIDAKWALFVPVGKK